MDLFDVAILLSMGLLALLFAVVAAWDLRDARAERSGQRPDADVIQHPQSERRVKPAA